MRSPDALIVGSTEDAIEIEVSGRVGNQQLPSFTIGVHVTEQGQRITARVTPYEMFLGIGSLAAQAENVKPLS